MKLFLLVTSLAIAGVYATSEQPKGPKVTDKVSSILISLYSFDYRSILTSQLGMSQLEELSSVFLERLSLKLSKTSSNFPKSPRELVFLSDKLKMMDWLSGRICGKYLPSGNQRLHDSRGRFHQGWWNWWEIHLWREIRRWKLQDQALWSCKLIIYICT